MLFLLVSVVGGLTPGASAPGKPPPGVPKPGYAVGEESRMETGPRQHEDRPPPRSQPQTTPGSAASSPCKRSGGPATATAASPASGPSQAGQPTATTTASEPGPRPATAPQSQDSGRPAPTPDDSVHAAQDAHRTRQRPPNYYINPSAATARQDARQRPTLDRWTGSGQDIESGYMQI